MSNRRDSIRARAADFARVLDEFAKAHPNVATAAIAHARMRADDISSVLRGRFDDVDLGVALRAAKRIEIGITNVGPVKSAPCIDCAMAALVRLQYDMAREKAYQVHSRSHSMELRARGSRKAEGSREGSLSRRTRCATILAVRLLPPADRARYREEFAAEIADLPRRDRAPYAIRLARLSWSLRRALTGKPSVSSSRVVVVVGPGAG